MSRRAALYARISTREGRQHLDSQLRALREFATRIEAHVIEEYTDQDSGAKPKRPGLDQLMKDAARRHFDMVIVFDLSRLTRGGPAQAFAHIARLNTSRVEFWSMNEELFRTAGPYGELFIALAAHIAHQERAMQLQRIRAGIQRARQNGTTFGRPRRLVDLARLAEMKEQGKSIREIARVLKIGKGTAERNLKEL